MTRISDMTPVQVTSPTGMYAPVEKTGSTTNYRVDLAAMSSVTPQMFGAVADGVTDDSAAFVAALAYLRAFALNAGPPGAGSEYKGSPILFVPAGYYYLGTTTLDIDHTLIIEGEGSGRMPAEAYGCTHLRWADGVCGIRAQTPLTSGTDTVDGAYHDGSGGLYIRDLTMQGGYTGTHSASHAIVGRGGVYLQDVLIRRWSGIGVRIWTGNVNGTNYGGNASVSRLIGVKVENCDTAFDTRGTDSNVVTFLNCEAYQCHRAGFIDNNGAGSNTYIGCHATYNGLSTTTIYTQVSYSSKIYAVRWDQEVGAATNAPSGTTADNTWWIYVGAGGVDASHPAWASSMANLSGGGDYVTLSAFPTLLINCYMEGGGFSQLSVGTIAIGGTNLGLSCQGGWAWVPESDGLALKNLHSTSLIHLDGSDGAVNSIDSRDSTGMVGNIGWNNQGAQHVAAPANGHVFYTYTGGVFTNLGNWATTGLTIKVGGIGYQTGAGAAVTQLTNKSTATPAINKLCGQVTMNNAALAGGAKVSFVVTNSTVAATDTVIVSIASGGTANAYRAAVTAISAGVSFTITVENITGGSLSEAPVVNFAILKAVAA